MITDKKIQMMMMMMRISNSLWFQALKADLKEELRESKATREDILHEQNQEQGRDKYKTLKQIRAGNTKQRIDQYESC